MNIVLITCDSLRYDHLSCNKYRLATSPNIDKFAAQASHFTHAFSSGPNTPHAFPGIFSSRNALMSNRFGLFDSPTTLAEELHKHGYFTIGINAGNPYVSRYFRYDRGFDFFQDYLNFDISDDGSNGQNKPDLKNSIISIPGLDMEHYLVSEENVRSKASLESTINFDIFEQLEKAAQKPFFLWVHYMDAHYPYLPQKEAQQSLAIPVISREENLRINQAVRENNPSSAGFLQKANQLYDAAVRQLDGKIGELFDYLRQKDLFDSSLIVFTADHGEEFMEHGDLQHKCKLYDELLHIPFIIKRPFQNEPEQNSNMVSLLQLAPTILEETECINPFVYKSVFSGTSDINSLQPSIVFSSATFGPGNGTPVGRDMSRLHYMPKRFSCRTKTNKVIIETNGTEFRFNLVIDASETVNSGTERQPFKHLKKILLEYAKTIEKFQLNDKVSGLSENLAF